LESKRRYHSQPPEKSQPADAGMAPLERIMDGEESICVGWVGRGVLYARFVGTISADMGERYAARLTELIQHAESLRYFVDSSALTHYDLLARSAIIQAVMAHRRKFATIISLTWAGGVGPVGRSFAAALGNVEYLTTREDF